MTQGEGVPDREGVEVALLVGVEVALLVGVEVALLLVLSLPLLLCVGLTLGVALGVALAVEEAVLLLLAGQPSVTPLSLALPLSATKRVPGARAMLPGLLK